MEPEELALNIAEGFQVLGCDISQEMILNKLNEAKKLGGTNTFIELSEGDSEYLIRLNGQLWAPYTRSSETKALNHVGLFNIDSSVRLNEPSFQICQNFQKSPHHDNLEDALGSIESDDKKIALCEVVSKAIVRYQLASTLSDVVYPFQTMILQALSSKNASAFQKAFPDSFKFFTEITLRALLGISMKTDSSFVSSHADLLPASIYVPKHFELDKIQEEHGTPPVELAIVDWEYCAEAYWAHDIALLTADIDEMTGDILVDTYIDQLTQSKKMPYGESSMRLDIRLTRFLHSYLQLLWRFNDLNPHDAIQSTEKLLTQMSTYLPTVILTIEQNKQYTLTLPDTAEEGEETEKPDQSPSH